MNKSEMNGQETSERQNTTSRARGYKWKEKDGFGLWDQDWIKLINAIGKEEKKCFLKEVRSQSLVL